jgi:DNA-binding NarL/FixJ family response regulator
MIRVLLVDDHPVVRDGLRGIFETVDDIEIVGAAGDGDEALALAAALDPDVLLLDLRMPGRGGVDTIRALRDHGSRARVLVLTTFDADQDVLAAIEAGATGYLLKDVGADELVRAVRSAHHGDPILSPAVAGRLMARATTGAQRAKPAALSAREIEVLRLVAGGATNKQAAAALFVSETTVKTHLLHVFDKLDVRDRAAAVDAAHRRGLL